MVAESHPDEVASEVVAFLPAGSEPPAVSDVLARLRAAELAVEGETVGARGTGPARTWVIELSLPRRDGGDPLRCAVRSERSVTFGEMHADDALTDEGRERRGLSSEAVAAAAQSDWCLVVGCVFGDAPLGDYHLQLRVLHAIASHAVIVLDAAACWRRSMEWLEERATSDVPPSPECLYSIHAVSPGDDDEGPLWLHTHGLQRCRSIELEMWDVPREGTDLLSRLLITVAAMFVERGVPEPGERFAAGAGIDLAWLPWYEGLDRTRHRGLGSVGDREAPHDGLFGVLLVPRPRLFGILGTRFVSPAVHLPVLGDNPVLYLSEYETKRRAAFARESLDRFRALFERFGSEGDWGFLVKLGYGLDGAADGAEREHLWFGVHDLADRTVDATLLNEPHGIAAMSEGDRGEHELARLSDWTVMSPFGQFEPDTVHNLEAILAREP